MFCQNSGFLRDHDEDTSVWDGDGDWGAVGDQTRGKDT